MIYIKLDSEMELVTTVSEPIYRGDNLARKITYLLPTTVGEIDMMTAYVYLCYLRADGVADIVALDRSEEKYNETYLQYRLPINSKLTKYPGEICTWLHILSGHSSPPVNTKSGECVLRVQDSKDMDDYINDSNITAIYQLHKKIDSGLDEVSGAISEGLSAKADNIVFDETDNTIQLISDGEPVGDRIVISATDSSAEIVDVSISNDGELIVMFGDGSEKNLGHVVGKDGAVYIPHISERKVLSFTMDDKPSGLPEPVDLNPFDEWSDIDEREISTSYVWEPM